VLRPTAFPIGIAKKGIWISEDTPSCIVNGVQGINETGLIGNIYTLRVAIDDPGLCLGAQTS